MEIDDENLILAVFKNTREPKEFIESLRKRYPSLIIQVFDESAVAGIEHIEQVVRQSIYARNNGILLSKNMEMDLLIRIACNKQINEAIEYAGMKKGKAILLAIGERKDLEDLHKYLNSRDDLEMNDEKAERIMRHHNITDDELDACIESGNKLAYILAERANLLY